MARVGLGGTREHQEVTSTVQSGVYLASGLAVKGNISGETVVTTIGSGFYLASGLYLASGIAVKANISGETVVTTIGSGFYLASGLYLASGIAVKANISGETVVTTIGSGFYLASGLYLASGIAVKANISGETVVTTIGSGFYLASGLYLASGIAVKGNISGETVTALVGVATQSGQYLASGLYLASGIAVKGNISGETVKSNISGAQLYVPTTVKAGPYRAVGAQSGGVVLHSGDIKSAVVKCLATNSGMIWVGGTGVGNHPYSGYGLCLAAGEAESLDIDNFHAIFLCAQISGEKVCFNGVAV